MRLDRIEELNSSNDKWLVGHVSTINGKSGDISITTRVGNNMVAIKNFLEKVESYISNKKIIITSKTQDFRFECPINIIDAYYSSEDESVFDLEYGNTQLTFRW